MPHFTCTPLDPKNDPLGWKDRTTPIEAICYGNFIQYLDRYSADIYYDADPSHQKSVQHDHCTCRRTKEEVMAHADLLRLAGFNFIISVVDEQFGHTSKPVPAYRWHIECGDNSPVMGKFLIHGIRYTSQHPSCFKAFHQICKEIDTSVPLNVFNALIVAQMAPSQDNHKVGYYHGRNIPVTQKQYEALQEDERPDTAMTMSIKQVQSPVPIDFAYLTFPGGYKAYMKDLETAYKASLDAMALMRSGLSKAMGIVKGVLAEG